MSNNSLTIIQPDDWHLHLRSGEVLQKVLPFSARHFGRAIIMPNLQPPVVRTVDALAYRAQIMAALPDDSQFQPLMTLYLTEQTDAKDVRSGFLAGDITAMKLYPAGATTNSAAGVNDLERVYPVLAAMEEIGMPLLVHGEVVNAEIDIFDREAVFIERKLIPLRQRFPQLKIVFEHLTTREGVEYVQSCAAHTAATITPHHLVINRNALLVGGIRPHYYCLPVAKRETHRQALCDAVTSGDTRFFLGTDSAPHADGAKESACGCAGVFNVAHTLSIVAEVFERADALDKLEGFVSRNGPDFYGLPLNEGRVTLKRTDQPQALEEKLLLSQGSITHFDPLIPLHWYIAATVSSQA